MAFLHLQEWEKAKKDLTAAKEIQKSIVAESFRKDYDSIADFEHEHNVKLPEDIAALLTFPQA